MSCFLRRDLVATVVTSYDLRRAPPHASDPMSCNNSRPVDPDTCEFAHDGGSLMYSLLCVDFFF